MTARLAAHGPRWRDRAPGAWRGHHEHRKGSGARRCHPMSRTVALTVLSLVRMVVCSSGSFSFVTTVSLGAAGREGGRGHASAQRVAGTCTAMPRWQSCSRQSASLPSRTRGPRPRCTGPHGRVSARALHAGRSLTPPCPQSWCLHPAMRWQLGVTAPHCCYIHPTRQLQTWREGAHVPRAPCAPHCNHARAQAHKQDERVSDAPPGSLHRNQVRTVARVFHPREAQLQG